jgi:hypothetical protein
LIEVYHVVGADTKAIVPMAEGIAGRSYGLADAGSASINKPVEDPFAVATLSDAQTKEITSPASILKVT